MSRTARIARNLRQDEMYMILGALRAYASKVSEFYGKKVLALARRIEATGKLSNLGTIRKAVRTHAPEVSPFYLLKLGTLDRKLAA